MKWVLELVVRQHMSSGKKCTVASKILTVGWSYFHFTGLSCAFVCVTPENMTKPTHDIYTPTGSIRLRMPIPVQMCSVGLLLASTSGHHNLYEKRDCHPK